MKKEEWKSVYGYEGYYEVSSYGNIRSLDREVFKSNGKIQKISGQFIKPFIRDSSKITEVKHYRVALLKDGIRKKYFVHRLVAIAFIRHPYSKEIINHIDNNGLNNYYKNLEWCTHKENVAHCHNQNRQNREKVLEAQTKTVMAIRQKKLNRELQRVGNTYGFLYVNSVIGFNADTKTQDINLECTCTICGGTVIKPARAFRIESIMMCRSCKILHKDLIVVATINKP